MTANCNAYPRHLTRSRLKGLYVITSPTLGGGHLSIAQAALAGGAGILQLRDKDAADGELLRLALALRAATQRAGALFIINDRVDLALACGADGVHLGPDDLPVAVARRMLGPHRAIGASCANAAEACAAEQAGADYVGAGAVFATLTKADAGAPIGLAGLRGIAAATSLPVAAVGGVQAAHIAALREAGAAMACVVTAVAAAGSPAAMTAAAAALAVLF